jgi:hypothetical protein
MAELARYEPDREVRVVGSEEDDWDCWDLDVYISQVRDGEHVELLVRPWVIGGWDDEDEAPG